MTTYSSLKNLGLLVFVLVSTANARAATDISTEPLSTYSAASSTDVKPNVLFILDDSATMTYNFMPDWANFYSATEYYFKNSAFNGLAYDPGIRYVPPVMYTNTGAVDTATYPSMTGTSTATGGDASATIGSPNWKAVKNDGYNVQSHSTSNLENNAYSYTIIPGEYCTALDLRTCTTASAPTESYPYSAKKRMCNGSNCQSNRNSTYTNLRMATPRSATLTVDGSANDVTSITVNGQEILSGTATASASSNHFAANIAAQINLCSNSIPAASNCTVVGYTATHDGNEVTILAPGAISYTPEITQVSPTVTATAFAPGAFPGENLRTTITSTVTSYPYPGTLANAAQRTDCAGATCTYAEEMTNYANWWAYYHTRMQTMKTAASHAFSKLDRPSDVANSVSRFRVGYMTISDNWAQSAFLNLGEFKTSHKHDWYTKFLAADPASMTPLRAALSTAGQLYAGKKNGSTFRHVTVTDPMQYSCQHNYTILSTDGYWNTDNETSSYGPFKLDNSTNVGNQDAGVDRPYLDGTATANTLADVAAYYYATDLRSPDAADGTGTCTGPIIPPATTATNLCTDNVKPNGVDQVKKQHMTTFTLGLGVQGYMLYTPDYWKQTSGDFFDIKAGTTATGGICSWQAGGACNWPVPESDSEKNNDDLWHAAINGRGTYYSASDPSTLSSGLAATLSTIVDSIKPGAAAAAASSNPILGPSDNYIFSSSYMSNEWYGELVRQQINGTTGALSDIEWSAMALLDCATTSWSALTGYLPGATYVQGGSCYQVATAYTSGAAFGATDTDHSNIIKDAGGASVVPMAGRTIYTKGASGLIPFTWANLSATQQAYFNLPVLADLTTGLSQFCTTGVCLTIPDQNSAAGANLVNFLRGDRSHEKDFFRQRTHVLGDIVSSEARYVKKPLFNYVDAGYKAYQTSQASRQGEVYVASNDGMLHAFNASTGQETWAYIPSFILPDLYKLADKNYSSKHQFFVDGSPEVGDIHSGSWKTILVGGMNRGGKGYYALDITDPASPVLLWEISTATPGFANLGYTYGNPKITKLKDGTWVVIFASGYNNTDGVGRLYVVDANSGTPIKTISTGVSGGLARISAHAPQAETDNTTRAVYGGDLLGNLWRFDVNGDIGAAGYDAQLLATLKDSGGKIQPITARPTVATIKGKPVVFVGTGRFLGTTDIADTSQQSFYAVKDNLDTTTFDNPHAPGSHFIGQTLTTGTCPTGASASTCSESQVVLTVSDNAVDWNSDNGWYIDFPGTGERSTTDSSLGLGTLVFTTIAPQATTANPCDAAATADGSGSFAYALNYETGGPVSGSSGVGAVNLGIGIATRPVLIRLVDGTIIEVIRKPPPPDDPDDPDDPTLNPTGSRVGGDNIILKPPMSPPGLGGARRSSWRTLH